MCRVAVLGAFWPGNTFGAFCPVRAAHGVNELREPRLRGAEHCDEELTRKVGLGQQPRGRRCSKMGIFCWRRHSALLERCQGSLQQTLLPASSPRGASKPAGSYLVQKADGVRKQRDLVGG